MATPCKVAERRCVHREVRSTKALVAGGATPARKPLRGGERPPSPRTDARSSVDKLYRTAKEPQPVRHPPSGDRRHGVRPGWVPVSAPAEKSEQAVGTTKANVAPYSYHRASARRSEPESTTNQRGVRNPSTVDGNFATHPRRSLKRGPKPHRAARFRCGAGGSPRLKSWVADSAFRPPGRELCSPAHSSGAPSKNEYCTHYLR